MPPRRRSRPQYLVNLQRAGRSTWSMDEALAGIHPDGPDHDPFDKPGDFMPKTYMKTRSSTRKRAKTMADNPSSPSAAASTGGFTAVNSPAPVTSPAPTTNAASETSPEPVAGSEPREPTLEPLGAADPGPATAMRSD